MPKTPLLGTLRDQFRDARASKVSGVPMDEIRDQRAGRRGLSRRGFLTGAAAGAAFLAIPKSARAQASRKITIVGGGIAGLNCALELRDAGFASTVYEASGRIGGRMFSNRTNYFGGQITEWGGEFIDTGHKTVRKLAQRYGLPLDNLLGAQPNNSRDIYKFGNQYYPATVADADFLEIAEIMAQDLEEAGYPTTWDAYTPEGFALDNTSVYDWIETRVPGGHTSPLGKLLDLAYVMEYGADARKQSSLNLLYLLAFQPTETQLDMFGESDEKFHVRGGNQQIPEAIAADLGSNVVKTGYRLVRLEETSNGRYRSTFERGSQCVEDVSDYVVLALPFAVLKDIDTSNAGFDARKRRAINKLGEGKNGKLALQFSQRKWLGQGAWPGKSNGSMYSDTGVQGTWDATRAQPGTAGILTVYSGGSRVEAYRTTSPFATAADANVNYDAQRANTDIATIYPGLSWNGRATESQPHRSPLFNASYCFYKTGQYTDFGGYEGTKQGGVYFCGEHTSQDYQGFMEGGAITGKDVAKKLAKKLG
jgi:monoamine oxidase